MDSNEQRPSTWPSSAPSTSYGIASCSRATRCTSAGSTYRNSASLSTNRLISQGHAIRSTAAFLRVTNFMRLLLCGAFDGAFGGVPAARGKVIAFDDSSQASPQGGQLAFAAHRLLGGVTDASVLFLPLPAHPPPDLLFVRLRQLCHRQHVGVAAPLDDVFRDPLQLLEQVLGVRKDDRAGREHDRAEALEAAPGGDSRRARRRRQPPRQDEPPRRVHAARTWTPTRRCSGERTRSTATVPAAAARQPTAHSAGSASGAAPSTIPPSDGPIRKPVCHATPTAPRYRPRRWSGASDAA